VNVTLGKNAVFYDHSAEEADVWYDVSGRQRFVLIKELKCASFIGTRSATGLRLAPMSLSKDLSVFKCGLSDFKVSEIPHERRCPTRLGQSADPRDNKCDEAYNDEGNRFYCQHLDVIFINGHRKGEANKFSVRMTYREGLAYR
jgi:hypothetical protein